MIVQVCISCWNLWGPLIYLVSFQLEAIASRLEAIALDVSHWLLRVEHPECRPRASPGNREPPLTSHLACVTCDPCSLVETGLEVVEVGGSRCA